MWRPHERERFFGGARSFLGAAMGSTASQRSEVALRFLATAVAYVARHAAH